MQNTLEYNITNYNVPENEIINFLENCADEYTIYLWTSQMQKISIDDKYSNMKKEITLIIISVSILRIDLQGSSWCSNQI